MRISDMGELNAFVGDREEAMGKGGWKQGCGWQWRRGSVTSDPDILLAVESVFSPGRDGCSYLWE